MKTIGEEFKRYIDGVYEGEILNEEQSKQVYMAFYAGALSCYSLMSRMAAIPNQTPEQQKVMLKKLRDDIFQACEDYIQQGETRN